MTNLNKISDLKRLAKQNGLTWKSLSSTIIDKGIPSKLHNCRIGGREFMIKEYKNGQSLDVFPSVPTESINFNFVRP